MTKPFDKKEVLARVGRHLETRDAYRSIIELQAAKLRQVHEAQQAILPRPVEFPEAAFGVSYTPIIEAGGDFYDVFPVGDGTFGYFAADFSGHDIRASYNTFALKALISQNTGPQIPPQETMQVINRVFTSLMKNGEHLTGVYARLDRAGAELTVVNAGHLPVLHLSREGEIRALAAEATSWGSSRTSCSSPSACRSARASGSFSTRTGCSRSSGKTRAAARKGSTPSWPAAPRRGSCRSAGPSTRSCP